MEAIVSSDHRRRMKEAALASRARCWFTPKWSPRRGYRSAQTGEPDRNCSMGAGGAVAEVADVYRWALDAPAEASDRVSRLLRQRSRSILNSWGLRRSAASARSTSTSSPGRRRRGVRQPNLKSRHCWLEREKPSANG